MMDAYMLGLLSADGFTTCRENKDGTKYYITTLELAEKQIIEDICKKYNKNIRYRQRIIAGKQREFWSVIFLNNEIEQYGKYLVKGRPNIKNLYDNFSSDEKNEFIRGVFDGDGSIVCEKTKGRNYYRKTIGFSVNSSQPDMKLIIDDFAKNNNLTLSSYFDKRGNGSWYLSFNGTKSLVCLYQLFFNTHHDIKNKRKYEIFHNAYTLCIK